jgi:cytochrome c
MKRLIGSLMAAAISFGAMSQAFAAGDAAHGGKVFEEECADCHSVKDGKNKKGPSLFNILGRKSATIADFNYSDAMRAKNTIWNAEVINEYIRAPKKSVPGGKMKYDGLDDEKAREEVINYLGTLH